MSSSSTQQPALFSGTNKFSEAIRETIREASVPKPFNRTALVVQADHADLVASSFKRIDGVHGQQELMHAILGVTGEVGELVDAIKKHVFYEKPLDMANVVEELGDIEYYLEAVRRNLNLSRNHILETNITKLEKRYPGRVFSIASAIERADKLPTSHTHQPHTLEHAEFQEATRQARFTEGDTL